jgi:hypothetical protein
VTWAALTAELRERVLATWVASPARFREDANAEDDVRAGQAERVVVELAQNAADAARGAGVAGRLVLELTPYCLYAANPGMPLDGPAVESLSHLRVSTKAAAEVGRYGVGFKAVLAITDDPAIVNAGGGVRWSRRETAEIASAAAAGNDMLGAEISRRSGEVPVMRLPFEAPDDDMDARRLLAEGNDTVVRLPLRDANATEVARRLLSDLDPLLPLFLPGLDHLEVRVDGRVRILTASRRDGMVELMDDGVRTTWRVQTETGEIPAHLLSDRPAEERARPGYQVSWAVPVVDGAVTPHRDDRRVRAPQPVAEQVALPAVLCASLPLDPSRGHVAPGPLAAWVCQRAAHCYVALLESVAPTCSVLALVPAELPAGPVDLALRDELAPLLPRARLLPAALGDGGLLRGEEAGAVDLGEASGAVTAQLASLMRGLVDVSAGGRQGSALRALGVRLLDTADVVDAVQSLEAEPSWWAGLYAALQGAPDRDALRGLPVPLADGRLARGPRDLLLASTAIAGGAALVQAGVPLRWVHPDASRGGAASLLLALGAREADVAAMLDDPAVRGAVEASSQDDEAAFDRSLLADGVLELLAADPAAGEGREWLSALALPTAEGELVAAGELLLDSEHGGRLVDVMADDSPFEVLDPLVVERHGLAAVLAAGVLQTFGVVTASDVLADPDAAEHWLDGEAAWLADVADTADAAGADRPVVVAELRAVRDLELVSPTPVAWTAALAELARPELRAVALDVAQGVDPAGRGVDVVPYTAWWLRRHCVVPGADGELHRPGEVVAADAPAYLRALYPELAEVPPSVADFVARLGVAGRVDDMGPVELAGLLRRLGERGPDVGRELVRRLYAASCDLLYREGLRPEPPVESVTAEVDGGLVVVPAHSAVVVDAPDLAVLLASTPVVPSAVSDALVLHDVLGVALASELAGYAVSSKPTGWLRWSELDVLDGLVQRLRLDASTSEVVDALGAAYAVHEGLRVLDRSGRPVPTTWRVHDGTVHVDRAAGVWALSRAIAHQLGLWTRRDAIAVFLGADEAERRHLLVEALFDRPTAIYEEDPGGQ